MSEIKVNKTIMESNVTSLDTAVTNLKSKISELSSALQSVPSHSEFGSLTTKSSNVATSLENISEDFDSVFKSIENYIDTLKQIDSDSIGDADVPEVEEKTLSGDSGDTDNTDLNIDSYNDNPTSYTPTYNPDNAPISTGNTVNYTVGNNPNTSNQVDNTNTTVVDTTDTTPVHVDDPTSTNSEHVEVDGEYDGIKLSYDEPYDMSSYKGTYGATCTFRGGSVDRLTSGLGRVVYNDSRNKHDSHEETYYSETVLPGGGLNIPGRHVASDGTIRDEDGYICVAADGAFYAKGETLMTSLGPAKVYDCGCAYGTIDIYVNSNVFK